MRLEVREVSRKTARDGRLEVSEDSARRLARHGSPLAVELVADGSVGRPTADDVPATAAGAPSVQRGSATLSWLDCTCNRGAQGGGHRHHFVQSPLFTALHALERVALDLTEGGGLTVTRMPPREAR